MALLGGTQRLLARILHKLPILPHRQNIDEAVQARTELHNAVIVEFGGLGCGVEGSGSVGG